MSYANTVKGASKDDKSKSGPVMLGPLPKRKQTELGFLDPVIVGRTKKGELIEKRFESKTQTIKISEALPFSLLQIYSIGSLMTVRLTDEHKAIEYSLLDCHDKMIQVRPGEGEGGIDIVIFEKLIFNLTNFHLHLYFDMRIRFNPSIKGHLPRPGFAGGLIARQAAKEAEEQLSKEVANILTLEDLYDEEAVANITGSPKGKSKEI